MEQTKFRGRVTDERQNPIQNAEIEFLCSDGKRAGQPACSNSDGEFDLMADEREGQLRCHAFGKPLTAPLDDPNFSFNLGFSMVYSGISKVLQNTPVVLTGNTLVVSVDSTEYSRDRFEVAWQPPADTTFVEHDDCIDIVFRRGAPGRIVRGIIRSKDPSPGGHYASFILSEKFNVQPADLQPVSGEVGLQGDLKVRLQRAAIHPTSDQALWAAIQSRTDAISFNCFKAFMDRILYGQGQSSDTSRPPQLDIPRGVEAYRALKYLTEAFLLSQSGVFIAGGHYDGGHGEAWQNRMQNELKKYLGEPPRLPYLKTVIDDAFPWLEHNEHADPVLLERIDRPPLIELIHEYWLEEGMLMQTINAVAQRFQNVRWMGNHDPLANLELDPLRRINNWMWGFIQDEVNRLTVKRRAFEYLHQYGLPLYGKAVPALHAAESRSKFLEAFHNLLHESCIFFKQDDQTTIIADAYPLLNSLQEVHLILAQGAHNQFGDLPWTARVETLLVQYILSQPAMRDFLQSRAMVPYQEAWMPQVDAMKFLQGWSDVPVQNFRNLAVYGEQIVLSIRYGNWIHVHNSDHAGHWAREHRPAIQNYVSSYRGVTGVDLTTSERVDATPPAMHLQKRLAVQHKAR